MKSSLLLAFLLSYCFSFSQSDERFYTPTKDIKPFIIQNHEEVITEIDTIKLTSLFFKPTTKAKATILFFQGSGGNYSDYQYITKPLVDAGYQVFMVQFRGYGKSTGRPSHLNIAADAEVIFDQLTERADVRKLPLFVYGASMGSQVAVHLTRKKQFQIKALILDSGFTSFTDVAVASTPEAQHAMIRKFVVSPYSAIEDIKFINNVNLLVIHSQTDEFVPFEIGKPVFDAANEPKQLYVYNGKHIEVMKTDSKMVISKIDKFLKNK